MSLKNAELKTWENDTELDDGLYVFLAKWCGHCHNFYPELKKLQKLLAKSDLDYTVNIYDESFGVPKRKDMPIKGFPTMFLVENNKVVDEPYARDVESLLKMLEMRGYQGSKRKTEKSKASQKEAMKRKLADTVLDALLDHPDRDKIMMMILS